MSRYVTLGAAVFASQVAAHGYLNTFTLDGTAYEGFKFWEQNPDPNAIGWSFTTQDEGPEMDITSPDFVCRSGSQPSANYGAVTAGSQMDFFWTSDDKEINPNGWAESHRGPVMTYIAPCNGDCASVDKTALRWTKIQESGLVSGPANTEGTWATDELRLNGGIASAILPADIADGRYVVRHELIAMHMAHEGKPEFYMQCGNIEVTGGGSDDLSSSGVVASEIYSTADNIFGYDVYNPSAASTWDIPGPALYAGAQAVEGGAPQQPATGTEQPATEPSTEVPVPQQPGDGDNQQTGDDQQTEEETEENNWEQPQENTYEPPQPEETVTDGQEQHEYPAYKAWGGEHRHGWGRWHQERRAAYV